MVAAKFRVIVTRRPKYAFRNEDGVVQAPGTSPYHRGAASRPKRFWRRSRSSKYADGLPLYRQEAIYARDKVDLDRALMRNGWAGSDLNSRILSDHVLTLIKKAERIFADETTLPTLEPGSGSTKTAYLWAYVRDDRTFGGSGPPMVAYRFEDSRFGRMCRPPSRQLSGHSCRWMGIRPIIVLRGPTAAMMPSRSRDVGPTFEENFTNCTSPAVPNSRPTTIERMTQLWEIEEKVRGKDPNARVAARQETSVAIVADLFKLWQDALPRISGKSQIGGGNPLRHLTAGDARTLPHRWPRRD